MPTLQVREVPTAVYGALTEASKKEHRSLAQQTLVTLERGLGFSEEPAKRRRRVIRAIAETRLTGDAGLPDPVDLVREDRTR
jgi:antitoxin FitA